MSPVRVHLLLIPSRPLLTPGNEPDTEIDFSTYLQQADVFLAGERDYSLIKGDSGPA